jgi:hypothetical protein
MAMRESTGAGCRRWRGERHVAQARAIFLALAGAGNGHSGYLRQIA